MSMHPTLFSCEALAIELGRDRRAIAKLLRDVPADGEVKGRPAWRLTTALQALRQREEAGRGTHGVNAACDAIERLEMELERGLACVRLEPDLGRRREMLRDVAPLVGRLDAALREGAQGFPKHEADLLAVARDQITTAGIAAVLDLGRWEMPSEDELAAAVEKEGGD